MEIRMEFQEIVLYGVLLAIVVYILWAMESAWKTQKTIKSLPEAAGAWPIIGHLHLLGANTLLHRTLAAIATQVGPVFSIRLGLHRAMVVNTWEAAKEIYTANDKNFASRPMYLATKIMAYDHAVVGFSPYGEYWRATRKLMVHELLSNHKLKLHTVVRDAETKVLVKELYSQCVRNNGHAVVEMNEKFGNTSMNIIVRQIAGKRYLNSKLGDDDESMRCRKALGKFFYYSGTLMFTDMVPFLGWLDYVRGYIGEMKKTANELDTVFENWLSEHKKQRIDRQISEDEQDFIHVMLSIMDDGWRSGNDADTVIKATCLSLLLGATDTNVTTLTWSLSLLLNNPDVLKKAQAELDYKVGKERRAEESDIENLSYLQAIVKETLRLYPPFPLAISRLNLEDCTVSGFHIPAGTRLLVNLWNMHRDPRVWRDPAEFKPERFINDNADIDVIGKNYELLPFTAGRRMCPGVNYALQVVNLTLARLLQGFEFGTVLNKSMDMTESPGMTLPKATPLEVILTPRLSSIIYG